MGHLSDHQYFGLLGFHSLIYFDNLVGFDNLVAMATYHCSEGADEVHGHEGVLTDHTTQMLYIIVQT